MLTSRLSEAARSRQASRRRRRGNTLTLYSRWIGELWRLRHRDPIRALQRGTWPDATRAFASLHQIGGFAPLIYTVIRLRHIKRIEEVAHNMKLFVGGALSILLLEHGPCLITQCIRVQLERKCKICQREYRVQWYGMNHVAMYSLILLSPVKVLIRLHKYDETFPP